MCDGVRVCVCVCVCVQVNSVRSLVLLGVEAKVRPPTRTLAKYLRHLCSSESLRNPPLTPLTPHPSTSVPTGLHCFP